MRRVGWIGLFPWIAAACLFPLEIMAAPERRVALVIGNGAYKTAPLKNPVNDARDIATALKELGFEVIHKENADKRAMIEAIDLFYARLVKADVGLFFFSGHGMQVKGRNFLIPVDARVQTETDVEFESVDAGRVLGKMESAQAEVNIVILDACRNNPFARSFRSTASGLARMDAPAGSFLAFSTAPGSVASDGEGRNGLFTEHLLRYIKTPGLKIEDVMKRVRVGVSRATDKKQMPWDSSSLMGDFYFASTGPAGAASSTVATAPPILPPKPGKGQDSGAGIEKSRQAEAQWAGWQSRMETEFVKIQDFDRSPKLKPEEKAAAWASFIEAFWENNPFSTTDDDLLSKARARWDYWKNNKDAGQTAMAAPPSGGEPTHRNSIGMNFVLIPAGSFLMGSPPDEPDRKDDETRHPVTISRSFYLQATEVTQGQWQAVMGNNPSQNSTCGNDCPVENISWDDARDFIARLNAKEGTNAYRLPTEAEWEYACRAGSKTAFSWGGQADCSKANYGLGYSGECKGTNPGHTMKVGLFPPNAWGLYDMHGNVWEWCADWYGAYPSSPATDPTGPAMGSFRVFRGGGWGRDAAYCRAALRGRRGPIVRNVGLGLRLARTP
ncbi:MAG: SUMF1/EgtB/PvdO family nonheme iron enzyme [Proteobacteria bacterium]|nr:SUMF1/EgtB/PvdO family nonheme iron enzyme [Pseudomonadota bacterium]